MHKSTSHNTSDCCTLKAQKNSKKKKYKRKPRAKANQASHNSELEDRSSDSTESGSDSGSVKVPSTRSAHVSRALMSQILAYVRSATKDFTCLHTIADSSASTHMTLHCKWFKCSTFRKLDLSQKIHFGDNSHVEATGIGTIMLECKVDGHTKTTELENALYVPSFQLSLISICQLDKAGYYTTFKNGACKIKLSKDRKVMFTGSCKGDLCLPSDCIFSDTCAGIH